MLEPLIFVIAKKYIVRAVDQGRKSQYRPDRDTFLGLGIMYVFLEGIPKRIKSFNTYPIHH